MEIMAREYNTAKKKKKRKKVTQAILQVHYMQSEKVVHCIKKIIMVQSF